MASLRVEHNPEQGTTEALSQPFVVFVNDNPTPRYRLTRQQAYELLTSLQRALRSEEHTSELQSLAYLVCRLLLEKKKIELCYIIEFNIILFRLVSYDMII